MPINILFIGDIFAKPGRQCVKKILPILRTEYAIDLVIANIENLAHGKGITRKTLDSIGECAIDAYTSGNHIWDRKEGIELLKNEAFAIVRPANYPPHTPGKGYITLTVKNKKVLIINFIGRLLLGNNKNYDDPFRMFDAIIETEKADAIIIDFHGEATSEKKAFAYYAAGRASLVVGTHTHTPTADAQLLTERKLGFVTDVGMVGAKEGVIGMDIATAIQGFLTQMPVGHTISEIGPTIFNSIYAELDGLETLRIERVDRIVEQ